MNCLHCLSFVPIDALANDPILVVQKITSNVVTMLRAEINDRLNAHELVIAQRFEAHISDVELIVKDILSSNVKLL